MNAYNIEFGSRKTCSTFDNMRILTGCVLSQENIKPEVLKVQIELARSVHEGLIFSCTTTKPVSMGFIT